MPGVGLVAVETSAGDAQVGGEAALHLGHVARPGFAGAVVVDQQLEKDLSEAVKVGKSTTPFPEQYRVMFEGIPCWPKLSAM